ncbi:MAG TPA: biotin--[acetyl-CoA-carboxylase] ligase [Longimicrobiales bacterium]|nr:biotin--[acetyl-CoA-carboxylase] ligase [Longimicrobiales bacterium]
MALLTHWDGEPVHVWARVWRADRFEAHDVLGSTNDRLRELAAEGAGRYSVVVAEEQTSGRGRSGGVWHSPPGSGIWISVLLPCPGLVPPHLPLVVGVAAARAAERACPGVTVGIKWPNDLQLGGLKVGGILCEHVHGAVVAGVGMNLRVAPGALPGEVALQAAALEGATSARVSVGELGTALLHELHALVPRSAKGLDGEIRGELERRDVLRDRAVVTQQAGPGTARGIGPAGALLLERPDGGRVAVTAGSVRLA